MVLRALRPLATLAARPGGRRRLRLHAQGPPDRADGLALPRRRAARPHRRVPARAFRDADVLAGRFDRGDLVRVRGRVERFRDELQVELRRHRARRRRARPTPPRSCPSPTATSTSSTASSSTSPARSTTRSTGAARARCSPTTRCARTGAARRARATATTPTSAACSSTRSPSRSSRPRRASSTSRLNSDLLITAALVHDLGKTREFTYGADIELTEEGRLLGHVELGLRPAARARARASSTPSASSRSRTAS